MFLPTTKEELTTRGWKKLDVILVTGDSYIDSPYIGVAVIGKVLEAHGYRVGIIAQPDTTSDTDITRLGEPRLFWGITAGCIDSMVANYTATGKKRKKDDYTPGGINDKRPDRATISYSNLIRKYFKNTCPLVLGGLEASLRRIPHYDFWSNKIRRSILFDAKAQYLIYGMGERAIVELAHALNNHTDPRTIRGLCYISKTVPEKCITLPPFEDVAHNKDVFTHMFHTVYQNNDPITAQPLAQKQDTRYLIQNQPAHYLSTPELDTVYDLAYERELHPFYQQDGAVKALETIRFSIATHRGCYGECNFCSIAMNQGRTVRSRSKKSILKEAKALTHHPRFKGIIHDVGGPTANMYAIECTKKITTGSCKNKRCIAPTICKELPLDHTPQRVLLKELQNIKGIKKVFVASGIRHDMVVADNKHGDAYLKDVVTHHTSGQMKVAPEHSDTALLSLMGKPDASSIIAFKKQFDRLTHNAGKKQFLTYYLIAAHPGSTDKDMNQLRTFALTHFHILPEQVQVFMPTPSTYSTLMYWTEKNPFTGKPLFVEKNSRGKEKQKGIIQRKTPPNKITRPHKKKY